AGIGRPAPAPLRGLPGGAGGTRNGSGVIRGLSGGVQTRHAAARWLRDRVGALGSAADRDPQHPRDNAIPTRPDAADAVTARTLWASRRDDRRWTIDDKQCLSHRPSSLVTTRHLIL